MAKSVAEHHVRLIAETAQYEAKMRSAAGASIEMQRAQGAAAAASQTGSKAASRFGLVAQQAGYQVQDFAVQVAGGQNAMVAFSQQASQMLGFFGAGGAIAGAIISVGVLGYRLLDTARNSEKAKEKVDELSQSFKELAKLRRDSFVDELNPEAKQKAYIQDLEDNVRREEMAIKKRDEAYRLLGRARDLGFLDRLTVFGSEQDKNQYLESLAKGLNVKPSDFGGETLGAREISDRADKDIEESQLTINRLQSERIAIEQKIREIQKKQNEEVAKQVAQEGKNLQEKYLRFAAARRENALSEMSNEEQLNYYVERMRFLDEIGARETEEYELAKRRSRELGTILLGQAGEYNNLVAQSAERLSATVLGLQNRLPQSLQVNTGASALGGVAGGGTAQQTLELQRSMLDAIRQLVMIARMDAMGSGVN